VGAWIETLELVFLGKIHESHPVWVRGLKPTIYRRRDTCVPSHPVWVRGLKQACEVNLTFAKTTI
jgi:hypothetical protein